MKFLVSKNLHTNPNFTLLLGAYAVLLLCYFIGDLFYLGHFFGISTQAVLVTLQGNEEEFLEPLGLMSLLEHIHIALFFRDHFSVYDHGDRTTSKPWPKT
jgi:hypothetical protein